ncbi:hypothetical protein [Paracoccus litorisediminis]|uniref:Uncharacterized protein n=1 Tax=Paracoccus litorisediminis TaxID=2006130 RepID=A0A844HPV4_9RHOB|nr:hypothetical protein [Paracoccus litorisediminis]MTH61088.1 hypothetical protein [Paracoccus litorisediminis]
MNDTDKRRVEQLRMEPLANLLDKKLNELAPEVTLSDISRDMGFATPNYLSMIRKGKSKMALTRVEEFARYLNIDAKELFLVALRQHHSDDVISLMQQAFSELTDQERAILEVARANLVPGENLTKSTKDKLATVFRNNKPAAR